MFSHVQTDEPQVAFRLPLGDHAFDSSLFDGVPIWLGDAITGNTGVVFTELKAHHGTGYNARTFDFLGFYVDDVEAYEPVPDGDKTHRGIQGHVDLYDRHGWYQFIG